MGDQREGRLREQFRDWYPTVEAGRWYPALELTRLVLEHRRSGTPRWESEPRIPCDQCFEFRGGPVWRDSAARTRSGDIPANHTESPADGSTPAGE
jgi:hypothetical protein